MTETIQEQKPVEQTTQRDTDQENRSLNAKVQALLAENQELATIVDYARDQLRMALDNVQTRINNLVLRRQAGDSKNGSEKK